MSFFQEDEPLGEVVAVCVLYILSCVLTIIYWLSCFGVCRDPAAFFAAFARGIGWKILVLIDPACVGDAPTPPPTPWMPGSFPASPPSACPPPLAACPPAPVCPPPAAAPVLAEPGRGTRRIGTVKPVADPRIPKPKVQRYYGLDRPYWQKRPEWPKISDEQRAAEMKHFWWLRSDEYREEQKRAAEERKRKEQKEKDDWAVYYAPIEARKAKEAAEKAERERPKPFDPVAEKKRLDDFSAALRVGGKAQGSLFEPDYIPEDMPVQYVPARLCDGIFFVPVFPSAEPAPLPPPQKQQQCFEPPAFPFVPAGPPPQPAQQQQQQFELPVFPSPAVGAPPPPQQHQQQQQMLPTTTPSFAAAAPEMVQHQHSAAPPPPPQQNPFGAPSWQLPVSSSMVLPTPAPAATAAAPPAAPSRAVPPPRSAVAPISFSLAGFAPVAPAHSSAVPAAGTTTPPASAVAAPPAAPRKVAPPASARVATPMALNFVPAAAPNPFLSAPAGAAPSASGPAVAGPTSSQRKAATNPLTDKGADYAAARVMIKGWTDAIQTGLNRHRASMRAIGDVRQGWWRTTKAADGVMFLTDLRKRMKWICEWAIIPGTNDLDKQRLAPHMYVDLGLKGAAFDDLYGEIMKGEQVLGQIMSSAGLVKEAREALDRVKRDLH